MKLLHGGELMLLLRTLFAALVTLGTSISTHAQACSILYDQKAALEEIASKGIVVRAKVVRGFDAEKKQSEILQVQSTFVGNDVSKYLHIYRSEDTFRQYIENHSTRKSRTIRNDKGIPVLAAPPPPCPDFTNPLKQDDSYERIALLPARSTNSKVAVKKWIVPFFSAGMVRERALETILKKAKEQGRFRERPPKSPEFGDCMNCSGFPQTFDF